ncbi:heat-inducible transcriptional repressor HrcA [Tepidibacillus infernus]|uniref:Heat-inducible transcription repressor HrcA n=1 Tax=Tepidibacillus decaturensis TaxID=1413211 RepID=A0A135L7V7_9BACI|nr:MULTISPECIES: heat-inducible transcriptional repressor HrcA [Tepidibacillus]KXG44997.1 heat-inducible transcriptional repressor HrcA [Tepidibacillus decaturensis]GBF10123.1 heat-inducible transcription repressor HrcA [Tepidibacillus sp. HK-1]
MLTERQKKILKAIVTHYIESAEPVGSRSISKRQDIGFSSATIRNEMADLEEMGYLEQPHTSAGRVPSNRGYRYYVDHLMNPEDSIISKDILTNISKVFTDQFNEFEQLIEQTAIILSQITNYTSIILGPEIYHTKLKNIQIVPITDESLVVILVTNTGKVEHKMLTIPQGVSINEIEKMVRFLNHKLSGIPLYQLKSKIFMEINKEFQRNSYEFEQSMKMIDQILLNLDETTLDNKIYMGGTTNILNQPEFSDINTIKDLLTLFEKTDTIRQLVSSNHKGIEVKIGTENEIEIASNCSIITATYEFEGKPLGTIGIFGPTRMDYGRVIRILEFLTKDLSEFISRLYK